MEPVVYTTIFVFLISYLIFRNWVAGKFFSKGHRCDGKTVIVTGASNGIGKETAIGMAERGAKVILACRDIRKGQTVCSEIIAKTKNTNIKVMELDLASFKSIRSFAQNFLNKESRLDVLINNASVMGVERCLTKDGLEMHMGVNHFGHFLLTLLLIDRLKESIPSRIVTVSNWGHSFVRFNKNDFNRENSYNRFHAYLHSKLANVLFTTELGNRLKHSGIVATSVNPGFHYAHTIRQDDSTICILCRNIVRAFSKIFLRTAKSAAQNTLFAALDFSCQNISGVYYDNFRLSQMNPDADNLELRSWLWDHSERVTGIRFPSEKWKTENAKNHGQSINRVRP